MQRGACSDPGNLAQAPERRDPSGMLILLALLASPAALPELTADPAGQALLRKAGVEGTFVLHDVGARRLTATDTARARAAYLPMSTFKVPNTLIGLSTGVIPDERFTLKWDGKDRGREAWNHDVDLPAAMHDSVVWYYQEVARRIGSERMREWIDKLGYGNRDLSGGIDRFWLDGGLRITPVQQVEFLERLRTRALPGKPEHAEIVDRIMRLESGPGWVWRGKTGTGGGKRPIGWLVGSVERDGRAYVYALFVTGAPADRLMGVRRMLARKLLERAGALPSASH